MISDPEKGSRVPSCWDPNFRILDWQKLALYIGHDRNCTRVYSSSFFLFCLQSSHSKHQVFLYASITKRFKSARLLMWQVDRCCGWHASEAFPPSLHERDKSIPDQLGNHMMPLSTLLWLSTVYIGCIFFKKWRALLCWLATTCVQGLLASGHDDDETKDLASNVHSTSRKMGSDGACWIWVRYASNYGAHLTHIVVFTPKMLHPWKAAYQTLATAIPFLDHPNRAGVFFRVTLSCRVGPPHMPPTKERVEVDKRQR